MRSTRALLFVLMHIAGFNGAANAQTLPTIVGQRAAPRGAGTLNQQRAVIPTCP